MRYVSVMTWPLRIFGPGLLAISTSTTMAHSATWRFVQERPVPKLAGAGWRGVDTKNPRLSAEAHVIDGQYHFRLYRDGRLSWERPAPSSWIMIPDRSELVIMVGKLFGEGTVTDGPNPFQGLTVYNARGKLLANVDVGVIRDARPLADGKLLVLSTDATVLLDLTRGGRTVWRHPEEVDDFRVFDQAAFFTTGEWIRESDEYRETLYETVSGRRLVSFVRAFEMRPRIFAVTTDQKYAFLRLTTNTNPLVCDVSVFRIGNWDQPELTINGLAGGPFVGDRSPDGTIAVAVLSPAAQAGQMQPRVEVRDASGNLLLDHLCEPARIDRGRHYLRFDAQGGALLLLYGENELVFERHETE